MSQKEVDATIVLPDAGRAWFEVEVGGERVKFPLTRERALREAAVRLFLLASKGKNDEQKEGPDFREPA